MGQGWGGGAKEHGGGGEEEKAQAAQGGGVFQPRELMQVESALYSQ